MTSDTSVDLETGAEYDLGAWEAATAKVLRKMRRLGDDDSDSLVWDKLSTLTLDGISVTPLGHAELLNGLPDTGEPGVAPYTRGSGTRDPQLTGWDIRGWFIDPATRADDISTELENGANSLWLTIGDGALGVDQLASILEPVYLDLAPVVLDAAADPRAAAEAFLAVLDATSVTAHPGTNLGADPIGATVRGHGSTDIAVAVELAQLAADRKVRGIVVDGTAVHDLGASDVVELAYLMFAAVSYLRALTEAGLSADEAAAQLDFRIAATDQQFATIAKFRAARALWNRVGELSGVSAEARRMRTHGVTSRPMMARYDSYANMLRTTVAAFAAGVGGADSVTVVPFDEPVGHATAFSRRIARNTSSLLIHESHVAKVTDPAGGAYATEKLTHDLAQAAWQLFGELDAARTREAAVDIVRARIATTVSERALLIATRKWPITGVTEFPNLTETLPERAENTSASANVFRYAGEFEEMRDDPAQSPVFLATMGSVAQYTARATFVSNLFAAGGVYTSASAPAANVDEVIDRYREAGSPGVVCVAGADPSYTEWGTDLVSALKSTGASHVILAGKGDLGQDSSAVMGLDALAFLRGVRELLGKEASA